MIWSNNIITILIMCILFLCAFRILDYASSKRIDTTTIIEGNSTQYGFTFPSANLADAKRIKVRIDTLDKLLEQFAEIQKKLNSNNPRLNITYEYKTPDKSEVDKNSDEYLYSAYSTSSEQKFDFSISGEPLNQTIHVKIPVGERGPNGVTGDRGDSGDDGEKGDKGIVGNEGLLQCS